MRALRILMAICLASLASASFAPQVQAHECETSCSQHCLDVVREYDRVAQANRDYCDGGEVTCVRNCTSRYSDGTCRAFGPDYCGRSPICVTKCDSRYSDGTCRAYAPDFCGETPINCVARCTARYTDASCRSYGADACGRHASCRENCVARYPDGSCREYGEDVCLP